MLKKPKKKPTVAKSQSPGGTSGHHTMVEASRCAWIYYVPALNVFYDMLFDRPPPIAQINESMATFGLIAGLMVTVAQAVMNTLQIQDVIEYVETNYMNSFADYQLWAPTGFALLSAAMLSVVVHYLASSCSDVGHMAPEVYSHWWSCVRWNLTITFALTVLGLTGVMLGAYNLFILQHALSEEDGQFLRTFCNKILCGAVMGGAGVAAPWLLMSMGLASSKWVESQLEDVPVTVDEVYEQLEAYRSSFAEDNFFCMEQGEFLAWTNRSLGPRKTMTPMSREFAILAFDTYKDEEMSKHLRSKKAPVLDGVNNIRCHAPKEHIQLNDTPPRPFVSV